MDAGKPWVDCGFVLGVTRVSVLVLPCEACDSHATLAAPNPDQPWLPNPARLQAWASPCRTAPCHTQLDHLPPLMLLILDASKISLCNSLEEGKTASTKPPAALSAMPCLGAASERHTGQTSGKNPKGAELNRDGVPNN